MSKNANQNQLLFWKNEKVAPLRIANPEDFETPVPAIMQAADQFMGHVIKPVSNIDELQGRNELTSFLFKNKDLRRKIEIWARVRQENMDLPTSENSFLYYYESKDNPYWQIVRNFLSDMGPINLLPNKLKPFVQILTAQLSSLEKLETNMAKDIALKLKQVARMEGVLWAYVDPSNGAVICKNDIGPSHIIGQKAFSAAWSPNYVAEIPDWSNTGFCKLLGIKKIVQKAANHQAREHARKSAVIVDFPRSIFDDTMWGLKKLLQIELPNSARYFTNELNDSEKEIADKWIKMHSRLRFQIYFSYNERGLVIRPISVQKFVTEHDVTELLDEDRLERHYDGLNEKDKAIILQKTRTIEQELVHARAAYEALKVIEFLDKSLNVTIGQNIHIECPETNKGFQWRYISNLYNSKEHQAVYRKLLSQRKYFWRGVKELSNLSKTIELFEQAAMEKNIPLCVPKIENEIVGVHFKNMAPINMYTEQKKMATFSFPIINGHMICLTGKHGRGKSVAGKSVLENIWLAHTGLPVFAESFNTDVKEMLGSITNDNGAGSTATVFAKKTKNLFDNITKIPAHKSILFIDEIGKGTQEESGMMLGKQILSALSRNGNSVIFNTQIIRLAEHAQEKLQAICLHVNNDHQFEMGIKGGQMEELIKEVGLNKYFKD